MHDDQQTQTAEQEQVDDPLQANVEPEPGPEADDPKVVRVTRVGWGVVVAGETVATDPGKADAVAAARAAAQEVADEHGEAELWVEDGQGRVAQKRYFRRRD